jgi:hypothetical protein
VKTFTTSGPKSFFDSTIVGVYCWAVIHDRPVSWACDPQNWPQKLRKFIGRFPSQPTMSRRLGTVEVNALLAAMEGKIVHVQRKGWVWIVDGKPLPIGGFSKDPDAKKGYATGGIAKGYKLHAVYGHAPLPIAWEVVPMNEAEPVVAARLFVWCQLQGYVLGDKNYDDNKLHRVATACGGQLVTERKRAKAAGLGHGPQSDGRLRSIELLRQEFGQALLDCRASIERNFGWLTNHSAGLAPLPAWVRRIYRVTQWVQAKLIGHFLYTQLNPLNFTLADE